MVDRFDGSWVSSILRLPFRLGGESGYFARSPFTCSVAAAVPRRGLWVAAGAEPTAFPGAGAGLLELIGRLRRRIKDRALAQAADLGLVDRAGAAAADEPGRDGGGLSVFARGKILQVESANHAVAGEPLKAEGNSGDGQAGDGVEPARESAGAGRLTSNGQMGPVAEDRRDERSEERTLGRLR